MTIPFKGYKHNTYTLNNLNVVRIDDGVDIVSSPSISGLGSVELNKDRVNYFSGGIRFQKVSSIDSITIKIKWITDDWADYDYLYVRVYDDANNKIFEKSYGNPDAEGTLTEFDWVTDSFTVGVSGGYIELYLTTDDVYPSKCYVDLSTEVYSTTTYEYDAESTSTKGETLDSRIEKYRFTKTIAEALDEVEAYPYYSLSGQTYGFVKWADGIIALRRSVTSQSYLESLYAPVFLWKTFHHDNRRTGYQPLFYSTIYFGSNDSYLYALNIDGSLKWKFKADNWIEVAPSIGKDGTIYFGCDDYYLYALNPDDGSLKWKFKTDYFVWSTPAIGDDGTIYFGSYDYYFYALNPDGTQKWRFDCGDYVGTSPAIGDDGTIYVGSHNLWLWAFNPDGSVKWKYYAQDSVGNPAIGDDGTIYFNAGISHYFDAVNPDGTLKWALDTGAPNSTPAIGDDGTIYVGSWNNRLYAINPDGTVKWYFPTGNWINTVPAIGKDGTIYFGCDDYYLYAINPNGTLKWKYKTGNYVRASPVIDRDGTIYFGSNDSYLYALNVDGSLKWKFKTGDKVGSSPALA
jgi:outer membrane protein assembly factor BamB